MAVSAIQSSTLTPVQAAGAEAIRAIRSIPTKALLTAWQQTSTTAPSLSNAPSTSDIAEIDDNARLAAAASLADDAETSDFESRDTEVGSKLALQVAELARQADPALSRGYAVNSEYKLAPDGSYYAVYGQIRMPVDVIAGDDAATVARAELARRVSLAAVEPSDVDLATAERAVAIVNDVRAGTPTRQAADDAVDAVEPVVQPATALQGVTLSAAAVKSVEQRQLAELEASDKASKAHVNAHLAALAGERHDGVSFQYRIGPDGNNYAVRGEVALSVGRVHGNPEATLRRAEIVQRAALAPVDPSAADMAVASRAAAVAAEARAEIREQDRERVAEQRPGARLDLKG